VTITILGRRWNLRFGNAGKGHVGRCDPPDKPKKEIVVSPRVKGQLRLDTIIHECTHAAGWHIDEPFVEQFATDLARTLWRLGYREQT
jgi:hypothetical protein